MMLLALAFFPDQCSLQNQFEEDSKETFEGKHCFFQKRRLGTRTLKPGEHPAKTEGSPQRCVGGGVRLSGNLRCQLVPGPLHVGMVSLVALAKGNC